MTVMPSATNTITSSMGYLEYTLLPVDSALMLDDMAKVFEYWNTVRGADWAPAWTDFKLHELPPSVVPMTVVVDVDGETPDVARFVYRFWGTRRAELYGRENKGREVRDALPDKSGPIIAEQCRLVMTERAPILFRNVYPYKPAEAAVCITLRLPIASEDGRRLDKIATTAIIVDNPESYAEFVSLPAASLAAEL